MNRFKELELIRFVNDLREQVTFKYKKETQEQTAQPTTCPQGGSFTPNEADPTVDIYG